MSGLAANGGASRDRRRGPSIARAGREIVAPERLVFTFAWEQGGSSGHGPETIVTVTFAELGRNRTQLMLQQRNFATVTGRDEHEIGWSSCLDRFAAYLAGSIR